ncbi:importin subunit alpha-like isoform X2 [Olea europaea var. sylvestris]|uniref:importin subunit alpha-like isoform X2 n=1 Tax=Olea europaea var. sylvestris TaxID=158386 RepID=UPI000C1D28A0|nr:importin subunit alpha-like isoform X2 [Olea europaea var. sylvestris]
MGSNRRNKISSLKTLIVDCKKVHLPEVIWRIPQLRHLLFGRCYLPCPARSPIDGESIGLGNLLTLSKVSSSSCTEEVFERVPNLNKLGIFVENFEMRPFFLLNLVNLPRLETLKITSGIYSDVSVLMNLTFPPNIKKLTLEGCHIPWKNMTIIGSMPNLEALKLQLYACHGPEWEPREGEFCKLKFLLLENIDLAQWRAYDTNFTKLERLILRRCFKLEEIPPSIGEVSALEIIDLDDASPSAVTSAEQIQEEQKDYGHDIKVRVLDMFHLKRLKQEKAEAQIMAKVWSNEDTLQLEATAQFCGLLFDSIPLSKELISGVVPRLVEFLARNDYPQLQCKAAEAITSISNGSSDNINIMIDHGAVPVLVSLLSSPEDVLREQALHLLGNFAGDSTKSRDLILSYGVLMPLLAQFNDKTKLSIMRKGTRTLSNICEGKTWPQFKQVKSAILPLAHLIHIDDEEVLNSACWALLRLSYRKKDIIQAGVFPRLVELLLYPSLFVLIPAMCIVHNIISDVDDIQIQVIIDKGALPCLLNLLTQNYEYMVKKATCWIITQVIQRTKDNIQAVIEAGIFSPLVQLLQNAEFGLQDAAAWAIFNATMGGSNEQIKFLVDKGCIKPLCDLLVSRNTANIIKYCLGGLENILKVGEAEKKKGNTEDVNVFAQIIEDVGGLQKIENLQTHDYGNVRRSAIEILVTYWHQEDDNDEDSDDDNNDDNDDEDVDDYDDDDNAADDDEDDNDEDSDSKANSLS